MVLALEQSPISMAPAFEVAASFWLDEDKIVETFRSGEGLGWHAHNHRLFCGTESFFRTGYRAHLVSEWLLALDGVGQRRDAIEDALVAKKAARIAALPPNADGLNQLRMMQASPVRAAVSPQRVAALDAKVVARRDEIGTIVTDVQIKQLDQYPSSLSGLRDIGAFKANAARGLEALAGPEAARRFQEAAIKRMNKVGEESCPAFRKALGEVKETEEGLGGFDEAVAESCGSREGERAARQAAAAGCGLCRSARRRQDRVPQQDARLHL